MYKVSFAVIIIITLIALAACTRRMAPFSPHQTNTEAHRTALTNQACLNCHEIKTIGNRHQASDNCRRCHRILQGE